MSFPWPNWIKQAGLGQAAFGLGAVQLAGIAISLAMSIILARTLGPAGLGQYAIYFSLANLLGLMASSGMSVISIREVAAARDQGRWNYIRGYLRFSLLLITATSLLIGGTGVALLVLFPESFDQNLLDGMPIVLAMVLPLALDRLARGILLGLGYPVSGDLSVNALRPVLALGAVAWLAWFAPDRLSPLLVLMIQAVALLAGLALSSTLTLRHMPREVFSAKGLRDYRPWARSGANLWFQEVLNIGLNEIVVLLLAFLSTVETVGFFRIAQRGLMIAAFGLSVIRRIASPEYARLHGLADRDALESYCRRIARTVTALQTLAFLGLLLLGHWIVALVFGAEFAPAVPALQILAAQLLLEAMLGSPALILIMARQDRDMTWITLATAVATVAFLTGSGTVASAAHAAIAMVAADALRQALAYRQVRRRLRIDPAAVQF